MEVTLSLLRPLHGYAEKTDLSFANPVTIL